VKNLVENRVGWDGPSATRKEKILQTKQPARPWSARFLPNQSILPQSSANPEKKKSFDWSSSNTLFLVENYNPKEDP
jgi:hypothetical protein